MAAPEAGIVPLRCTNHFPFPNQLAQDTTPSQCLIWRETLLQVPVSLEVIADGSHLSVVKMWRDRDHKPLVRLQHPKLEHATADYWICWVTWITKGSNKSA